MWKVESGKWKVEWRKHFVLDFELVFSNLKTISQQRIKCDFMRTNTNPTRRSRVPQLSIIHCQLSIIKAFLFCFFDLLRYNCSILKFQCAKIIYSLRQKYKNLSILIWTLVTKIATIRVILPNCLDFLLYKIYNDSRSYIQ